MIALSISRPHVLLLYVEGRPPASSSCFPTCPPKTRIWLDLGNRVHAVRSPQIFLGFDPGWLALTDQQILALRTEYL